MEGPSRKQYGLRMIQHDGVGYLFAVIIKAAVEPDQREWSERSAAFFKIPEILAVHHTFLEKAFLKLVAQVGYTGHLQYQVSESGCRKVLEDSTQGPFKRKRRDMIAMRMPVLRGAIGQCSNVLARVCMLDHCDWSTQYVPRDLGRRDGVCR